jgi:lipid II isoglutaminyl synthase (glutamine-hydrolysing)
MIKRLAAIYCGKIILLLIKILNKGAGTAAPGLYALKIDQTLPEFFFRQITKANIVISGTNGKTTTSRLISHYLSHEKITYVHNRAGSNLERGIVSACLEASNISGALLSKQYGLWEVDEAVFPNILPKMNPEVVVLLNLFRDQLDRYGEVDSTRRKWKIALEKITRPLTIIYNADDPQLADLVEDLKKSKTENKYFPYGMLPKDSMQKQIVQNILSPIELSLCPNCKTNLEINPVTIIGQGKFKCGNCGLANPDLYANFEQSEEESQIVNLEINSQKYSAKLPIKGVHNKYNFLAAAATSQILLNDTKNFIISTQDFTTAFGRNETVKINDSELLICLIKNPTGFTETLKSVTNTDKYDTGIFILNDNFADGRDVSWIWDVNISEYVSNTSFNTIICSGTRAHDIALRLFYAGIERDKIQIKPDIEKCLEKTTQMTHSKVVPIFATYTGMLQIQKYVEKSSVKKNYLEG